MSRPLVPLPQHRALTDWLRQEEPEVWRWFAAKDRQAEDDDQVRLSLLQTTYRMDEAAHPEVFREIRAACEALGTAVPVHAYQAQGGATPNAAVCHLAGEAHLMFEGPLLALLTPDELRGVIGHELAHDFLWRTDGGIYLLADRILDAAAAHPGAEPAHGHSARVWRLATELFADRGAYLAAGSLEAAVGGLVKTTTGLSQVSAASYLAQAAEIFSKSKPRTDQLSHPETFIRARALQLWVDEDPALDEAIERMLDCDDGLDDLTLVRQARLSELTRRLLAHLLQPAWFQTDAVLAHARLFFREFQPAAAPAPELLDEVAALPAAQREFLCQVMLDFCAVDADLHDQPARRALAIARQIECLGVFEKLLTRELKMKASEVKKLKAATP